MPKFKKQKTSFVGGEQSPLLDARTDLDKHQTGAKNMDNVIITPTGAVKRRYGTEDLENLGTFFPDRYRLESFELSSNKSFLLIFEPNLLRIFDTNTNTISANIPTIWDKPREVDTAQSLNTMVLTHPDHKPMKLFTKDGTVNGFIIEEVLFNAIPKYNFDDDFSPISQQDVTRFNCFLNTDTTLPNALIKFKLSVNGELTRNINSKNEPDADYVGLNNKIRIVFSNNINTNGQQFSLKIKDSYSGYEFDLETDLDGNPLLFDDINMVPILRNIIAETIDFEMWNGIPVIGSTGDRTNITANPVTVTYVSGSAGVDFTFDIEFGTGFADFSIPISAEGRFHIEGDVKTTDILQTGRLGYSKYLDILTAVRDLNIWKNKSNVRVEIHNSTDHTPDIDISRADPLYVPALSTDFNEQPQGLQGVAPAIKFLGGVYTKPVSNTVAIEPEFTIKIIGNDAGAYEIDALVTNDATDFVDASLDASDPAFFKITKLASGKSKEENVWSTLRGYPAKAAFVESRLILGGGNSLPNFLWMSRISDFFNFDEGDGKSDDAINNISPTSSKLNDIEYIIGKNSLQLFTSGSEHYNPRAITPTEISLPMQSNEGCRTGIKPVIIDNSTFFLDRKGKTLRQFIYDDLEQSYKASNASILANHLITDIKDMTAMKDDDLNFVFLLREDGRLTVVNSLREQNILNFSNWFIREQNGFLANQELIIDAIQAVDNKLYAVIQNQAFGTKLIQFNKDLAMDLSIRAGGFTPAVINTFYPFTVSVVDDNDVIHLHKAQLGNDLDPPVIEQIITDGFSAELGIHFDPFIQTKDASIDFGQGQEMASVKKLSEVQVSMIEGAGWEIEYEGEVYDINDETDIINNPIGRTNGDVRIRLLGYTKRGNIIIRQNLPLKDSYIISLITTIKVR